MEKDKDLYFIVEYILNRAGEKELDVITEALKRRIDNRQHSPMGIDINKIAHDMGTSMTEQVASSRDYIRNTVKDFVIKTIKQEVPDIPENDLNVLLDEWVPSPGKKTVRPVNLPPDVIVKMIDQFLRFSSGQMPVSEQADLNNSIPDWKESYWKNFPERIRGLLTLYLKGRLDSETCWIEIKKELYSE